MTSDPKVTLVGTLRIQPITVRGSVTAWAEAENAKGHYCACGCGGRIKVLPQHWKRGIPKLLVRHYFRTQTKEQAVERGRRSGAVRRAARRDPEG